VDVDTLNPLQSYVDNWEVLPGSSLVVRTSCLGADYDAQIVRVLGGPPKSGDTDTVVRWEEVPAACAGTYPAVRQQTVSGSYAVVDSIPAQKGTEGFTVLAWVFPTLPQAGRRQAILSHQGDGIAFSIELTADGQLAATWSISGDNGELVSKRPVRPYTWYFVAAATNGTNLMLIEREVRTPGLESPAPAQVSTKAPLLRLGDGRVYVGVLDPAGTATNGETTVYLGAFNGKIEAPAIIGRTIDPARLAELSLRPAASVQGLNGLIWSADFSLEPEQFKPLTVVNSPMRRMTGHSWKSDALDWRIDPTRWAAVWFHDDDLDDARWPEAFRWEVPPDATSGMYAVRLSNELGEDLVPFFVRAPSGRPSAPLAFIAPTFSYTAYSNFWHVFPPESGYQTDDAAHYLSRHPELGMSMYMRHRDGSGVSHVSWRRPMVDMRLDRRLPTRGNAGREVSGDLFLIEWLEAEDIAYDVVTDLDVHTEGVNLLSSYKCVLTGGHPEYVSGEILDALQSYVDNGGRLMSLGGNGFYWVTSLDRDKRHIIEVRRGRSGSRTWTGLPGEQGHTDTGEPGGHWRDRGRAPQVLTGVGFCAQGGGPGAGFIRTPESERPESAFVFSGIVQDEIIGDFGDKQGGAAGDELDRFDIALGTPAGTMLLATSVGLHDGTYQHAIEEVEEMNSREGGDESTEVRADMTLFTNERGGAVFSVGSISWSASLAHNDRDNNVARVTRNVIEHFAS